MLRYYASDADWQEEVQRLVSHARAVLVLASASTLSLSWELRHLRETSAHTRTFFILPPHRNRVSSWMDKQILGVLPISWPALVEKLKDLGYILPTSDPGPGSVIGFDHAGRAVVLTTGADTGHAYATAIARGLG